MLMSAVDNQLRVNSKPEKVKVYQKGAVIDYKFEAKLDKGTNIIFIDLVPANIDQNSIIISPDEKVVIKSIGFKLEDNKSQKPDYPKNIDLLEDSVSKAEKDFMDIKNKIEVLEGEEKLISNFKIDAGKNDNPTVKDLMDLAQFYSNRLLDIKSQLYDLRKKVNKQKIKFDELQTMLNTAKSKFAIKYNYQIIAEIYSDISKKVNFNCSYYLPEASWKPSYDINVASIDKPVDLTYKAGIWQNSGYAWKDVDLVLSTRNPNASSNYPILVPWYLYNNDNKSELSSAIQFTSGVSQSGNGFIARGARADETITDSDDTPFTANVVGSISSSYLSYEYFTTQKYSIESSGYVQNISVDESEIKANYQYYAAPELDNDAFLVAKISDWKNLRLLPGEANVYFENSFIGKTYINPEAAIDTLTVSLGRDKGIIIKRDQTKEYNETKFLSSNIVKTIGYKLKIFNNKKIAVNIIIEERTPKSTDEKIKVEILEKSGAVLNEETGYLKWNLNIPAEKSEERIFGFKIDTPK
jgi:uncharacterized protein (TIGR02231 family)